MLAGLLNWSQCTFASKLEVSEDKKVGRKLLLLFTLLYYYITIKTYMQHTTIHITSTADCQGESRVRRRHRGPADHPASSSYRRPAPQRAPLRHPAQYHEGKYFIFLHYTYYAYLYIYM